MDKFKEDLASFQEKYPEYKQNVFGLAYPEHWDPMTRGDLKDPKIGMVRPVAKRTARKVKLEEDEEDYSPPGGSQIKQRFSRRTRGSLAAPMESPVPSVFYSPNPSKNVVKSAEGAISSESCAVYIRLPNDFGKHRTWPCSPPSTPAGSSILSIAKDFSYTSVAIKDCVLLH